MRSIPKKTTAIVLAGAIGLSSIAYGIGTQTGGGSSSAAAANNTAAQRACAPPGLDNLANDLGVEADELRAALSEFHGSQHADMRTAFAAALAGALDKSTEKVQAALEEVKDERPARPFGRHPHRPGMALGRLAAELDVTRAELRKALREMRADFRPQDRRDELVTFLAERFNLSEEKVEAALPEFPGRGPGGPHGPRGPHPIGP